MLLSHIWYLANTYVPTTSKTYISCRMEHLHIFANAVYSFWNEISSSTEWKEGLNELPWQSPDLTPMDFFLWVKTKD
jgi:hypothetical protein